MPGLFPRPEPRDAFKRALRAHLMAQAPGVLAPRETAWSRVIGGLMRPALVAAAIALLIATGAGRAAAGSLPGDAAYPLKVAAEQVQLAFALDDTTRLRILAQQADHRLAELAEAVSTRHASAPAAEEAYATAVKTLTVAVDAVRSQPNVSEDHKAAALDVVDNAHEKHEAVLDDLRMQSSPDEQPEIERAKQESDKLHAAGKPVRTIGPVNAPERSRSPLPARTASPSRTPERDDHQQEGSTRPPQQVRTPEPSRSPGSRGEGTLPPGPADRR
jgi:hypothetical protein